MAWASRCRSSRGACLLPRRRPASNARATSTKRLSTRFRQPPRRGHATSVDAGRVRGCAGVDARARRVDRDGDHENWRAARLLQSACPSGVANRDLARAHGDDGDARAARARDNGDARAVRAHDDDVRGLARADDDDEGGAHATRAHYDGDERAARADDDGDERVENRSLAPAHDDDDDARGLAQARDDDGVARAARAHDGDGAALFVDDDAHVAGVHGDVADDALRGADDSRRVAHGDVCAARVRVENEDCARADDVNEARALSHGRRDASDVAAEPVVARFRQNAAESSRDLLRTIAEVPRLWRPLDLDGALPRVDTSARARAHSEPCKRAFLSYMTLIKSSSKKHQKKSKACESQRARRLQTYHSSVTWRRSR